MERIKMRKIRRENINIYKIPYNYNYSVTVEQSKSFKNKYLVVFMKKISQLIILSLLVLSCDNTSKTKGVKMTETKPKVVGVGGVFFKSENPEETKKWYEDNLGLPAD